MYRVPSVMDVFGVKYILKLQGKRGHGGGLIQLWRNIHFQMHYRPKKKELDKEKTNITNSDQK